MVENKGSPEILPGSEVHRRLKRKSLHVKDRSMRKCSGEAGALSRRGCGESNQGFS